MSRQEDRLWGGGVPPRRTGDLGEGPVGTVVAVAAVGALALGLIGVLPTPARTVTDEAACWVGSLVGGGGCGGGAGGGGDAGTTVAGNEGTDGDTGGLTTVNASIGEAGEPDVLLALLRERPGQGVDAPVVPPGQQVPPGQRVPPGQQVPPPGQQGVPPFLVPNLPRGTEGVWPPGSIRNDDGTTTVIVDGVPIVVDPGTSSDIDGLGYFDPLGITDESNLTGSNEPGMLDPNRSPLRYGNRVPGSFVEDPDGALRLNPNLSKWMSPLEFLDAIQDPRGREALLRNLADLVIENDGNVGKALEQFAEQFGTASDLILYNTNELADLLVDRVLSADGDEYDAYEVLQNATGTPADVRREELEAARAAEEPAVAGGGDNNNNNNGNDRPTDTGDDGSEENDENEPEDQETEAEHQAYVAETVRRLQSARRNDVVDISRLTEQETSRYMLEIRSAVARGARLDATFAQTASVHQGNVNILMGWHGRSIPILVGLGTATTATVAYLSNEEANRRHEEAMEQGEAAQEQARLLDEINRVEAERRRVADQLAADQRFEEGEQSAQERFEQGEQSAEQRALAQQQLTLNQQAIDQYNALQRSWNQPREQQYRGSIAPLKINGYVIGVVDESEGRIFTPAEVADQLLERIPQAAAPPSDLATGEPLIEGTTPLTRDQIIEQVQDYYDSVPGLEPTPAP